MPASRFTEQRVVTTLRQVEVERRRLKQMVIYQARQADARGGTPKKLVSLAWKRTVVQFFRVGFRLSESRACHTAGVAWSSHRY